MTMRSLNSTWPTCADVPSAGSYGWSVCMVDVHWQALSESAAASPSAAAPRPRRRRDTPRLVSRSDASSPGPDVAVAAEPDVAVATKPDVAGTTEAVKRKRGITASD